MRIFRSSSPPTGTSSTPAPLRLLPTGRITRKVVPVLGTLPAALTLDKLRLPHASIPGNPLLAESLYLTKYIERMGTGTRDMIRKCVAAGLPEPEFSLTDSFVTTIRRVAGTKSAPGTTRKAHVEAHEAHEAKVTLTPTEIRLLEACKTAPRNSQELLEVAGYTSRTGNFKRSMDKLLQGALLNMTHPEKPRSQNQRYETSEKGRRLLKSLKEEGHHP